MPPFSFGASASPSASPSVQYGPYAQTRSTPVAPPEGAPNFLQGFLQQYFQHLAQQDAQQGPLGQGKLNLQGEAIFGRHLGMDGAPIDPQKHSSDAFFAGQKSHADVIAQEREHFGGASRTAGDMRLPTAEAANAALFHPPGSMPSMQRPPQTPEEWAQQQNASWVHGVNPSWGALGNGNYDMLMANKNKGQGPMFGSMFGSLTAPKGANPRAPGYYGF